MQFLNHRGVVHLSKLLLELYAPGDLPSFRRRMLKVVHQLFGGEMVCHNEINLATGQSLSVLSRPVEGFETLREAFFEHVHEHPSIQHLIAADGRQPAAIKTSDFVTQRKWRASGLYREFYRELDDIRYQLTIGHKIDGWLLFFAVSRKNSDFTDEERSVLTLLRPHFIQAYENARIYSGLQAMKRKHSAFTEPIENPAWLLCNYEGTIITASEAALQAVERWFPSKIPTADRLPPALRNWLRREIARPCDRLAKVHLPFRIVDHRGELNIRLFRDATNETCELIFVESHPGEGAGMLRSLFGLSRRETEVLRWLVEGKTNAEIAAILGLSLSTVKTHISNILRRLGVETRSAAVARTLELTRWRPSPAVNGLQ